MNTANIKKYAPLARTQFCHAITQKLISLGISLDKNGDLQIANVTEIGDRVRFGRYEYPKTVLARRHRLVERAHVQGYTRLIEHVAYTWFNRLCAIRYMELHGYLDHGFRVLSHPTDPIGFEVLAHVPEVVGSLELSDPQRLVEMKLAGDQDEALYRELLLGQCHFLHKAMPFLFDSLNDETELLLPDNLTRTDSILRGLVDSIPEEDWKQVEIIGWLYQFYISERKEQVIGKVVKSEDIPAATQLFTPNWIVQYLVQNSVGRQWLQTYPDSPLKECMPYYIEPAEQITEVQVQLATMTPNSIKPESIKVLDPACGSGHIIIEAYNVLKRIYEERGYRRREIPQLILENNIFGLDIDDRAVQLSGFVLLMMARQDDSRIFTRDIRLNVLSLQESSSLNIPTLWQELNLHQQSCTGSTVDMFAQSNISANSQSADEYQLLERTLALFTQAKTFGSLIQVPQQDEETLKVLLRQFIELEASGDTHQKEAAHILIPFIHQAWLLAQPYDVVVANPPYMSTKGMNGELREFARKQFPDSKSDLFAMFMQHAFRLLKVNGFNAQVNMQSWMFLSSFEKLREWLLDTKIFVTMAHLGSRAFGQISGEVVQTTAWVMSKYHVDGYLPVFFRLIEGGEEEKKSLLIEKKNRFDNVKQDSFRQIPGVPIAYWISTGLMNLFKNNLPMEHYADISTGLSTGNNDRFLKMWTEINHLNRDWIPCQKGGSYRKWYGNNEFVIDWGNNGEKLKKSKGSTLRNVHNYFREGISWTRVSSASTAFRYFADGFIFESTGPSFFPKENDKRTLYFFVGLLNSKLATVLLEFIAPTLDFLSGHIAKLPCLQGNWVDVISENSSKLIEIAKEDWDNYEISWDFKRNPMVGNNESMLLSAYKKIKTKFSDNIEMMKDLEFGNNSVIVKSNSLEQDVCIDISLNEITLTCNPHYRYGNELTEKELENRFQSDTLVELLSYIIGCIMGRYSLDREGLVYAHAGNQGFAELVAQGAYKTFPADNDGILPLMASDWFDGDVTVRVREFVCKVWGEDHLQENLDFIAKSLCLYVIKEKRGESSLDTIRRYISIQFWKDHLKTYKKRPIYWLFSSGKEKAFECLVYLHRYNDSTLARMRTEYVVPLLARYQRNIDLLQDQRDEASSAAETNLLKKRQEGFTRKFNELRNFDDRLRHYADMRISLDLDDGVKVNYGKFGDLLADVKVIAGNPSEVA